MASMATSRGNQICKGSYCCGDKTYQVWVQLNLKPHSYETPSFVAIVTTLP